METQKNIEKLYEVMELQELPLQYTGITLNNQDIDLMMIATSDTFDALEESLKKVTNIKTTINQNASIEDERQRVFDLYMHSLTPKVDYLKKTGLRLSKKIEYLKQSGILSREEIAMIDEIISTGNTQQEMMRKLIGSYSQNPSRVHQIYKTLRDYTPIEKTGIIGTSMEAYRNLYNQIQQNYNSITIDEEAKYGSIVLGDGTFDFDHLKKSLDFAKETGKQVRLNTLIFYQDCPEYLYQLPKNEESKRLVKQKLMDYVSATTKFIAENGYGDVVRSYDVFNELLNRFSLDGTTPYQYRGDIDQSPTLYSDFDNVKSGWLKHLEISDLCDIITEARRNLPTADFMFNDDNWLDPRKIEANKKLILEIQQYEKEHGVKLIDSIGTQMHIDNNSSKTDIENMMRELSKFGLPIEITEFDIVMTKGTKGLSDFEIEILRQQKINEVYSTIEELREECNIRGFTIWSKTNRQNFRVTLENERRIKADEPTIESLHGGVFTENMEPKSKTYKFLLKNNFQTFGHPIGNIFVRYPVGGRFHHLFGIAHSHAQPGGGEHADIHGFYAEAAADEHKAHDQQRHIDGEVIRRGAPWEDAVEHDGYARHAAEGEIVGKFEEIYAQIQQECGQRQDTVLAEKAAQAGLAILGGRGRRRSGRSHEKFLPL